MKQRFGKYDFEILLLNGSYVSDPNARRALIEDGNDRCSVEEYASRYFRRLGYSALSVENEPVYALFGVFMSPLIQDASDPHGRTIGLADRFAFDAGTAGKSSGLAYLTISENQNMGCGVRRQSMTT
jgi:hypothetical protein